MEIKKDLIKLREGGTYIAGSDDYLITEDMSLNDVIRWMVAQSDIVEIKCLIDMFEDKPADTQ